jgi:arabinoxylan arabinofuranohydrolase
MGRLCCFFAAIALTIPAPLYANNPVVPNVGMADPHVHFFNGSFYMYATHDFAPNNTGFLMKDWWVWSSPDLITWKLESVLEPQDTPSPPSAWDECWATDGASRNGSYFFYLSIGPNQVAVVNGSSPIGPWQNTLGKPLLPSSMPLNPPTTIRDPCVFVDDDADASQYILFGTFVYYIAKLAPDMMSLAETPRLVTVVNPLGPYGNETDDKPFLHKANGLYYLSWGCFYGIGDSPYGPFTYTGSVVQTSAIGPAFQMNETSGEWYTHEDYADRHGSFWMANNQWYYACNDRSHSIDPDPSVFRDTVISYVHYYSNGSIAPVIINSMGVGNYEAARVEAENYFAINHAYKGHTSDGTFGVHGLHNDSIVAFPHVHLRGGSEATHVRLYASNGGDTNSTVIVRIGNEYGPILSTLLLPPTGAWHTYASVESELNTSLLTKDMDIVLTFEGHGKEVAHIDWWALE